MKLKIEFRVSEDPPSFNGRWGLVRLVDVIRKFANLLEDEEDNWTVLEIGGVMLIKNGNQQDIGKIELTKE